MNQAKLIGLGLSALVVAAVAMTHESSPGGGADGDGCPPGGPADPNGPAAIAARLIAGQLAASNLPTVELAARLDAEAAKFPKGSDGYCVLKAAANTARGGGRAAGVPGFGPIATAAEAWAPGWRGGA